MTGDERLNLKQTARYLGLFPGTVAGLARAGELTGIMLHGRWSFLRSDVDRYIESCRITPGSLSPAYYL